MSSVSDKDIRKLKEQLEQLYEGKNIKAKSVLQLTRQAMVIVASLTHLTGPDKKELVMDTINIMIEDKYNASGVDSLEDAGARELLKFVVNEVAPPVIDDLVSAFKGDFAFKKSHMKFCPCF